MRRSGHVCRHCGDHYEPYQCSTCRAQPAWCCPECHDELAHEKILDQNVHLTGNTVREHTLDEDPDAWKPSWKSA